MLNTKTLCCLYEDLAKRNGIVPTLGGMLATLEDDEYRQTFLYYLVQEGYSLEQIVEWDEEVLNHPEINMKIALDHFEEIANA